MPYLRVGSGHVSFTSLWLPANGYDSYWLAVYQGDRKAGLSILSYQVGTDLAALCRALTWMTAAELVAALPILADAIDETDEADMQLVSYDGMTRDEMTQLLRNG